MALTLHRDRWVWEAGKKELPGPIAETIAYLTAHKQPHDQLFVWGFQPEVYYFTRLKPASRFIFANPVAGYYPAATSVFEVPKPGPIFPGSLEALLSDLNQHKPRWIVDAYAQDPRLYGPVNLDQMPSFKANILQDYVLDTVLNGENGKVPVYRRQE
jgi:hypothetical protein